MSTFADEVRAVVRKIPKGSTLTYKEVAIAAKHPRAARAVANIMAQNFAADIPCHRVIKSDGTLGGYNRGGTRAKKQLLIAEGAVV
jgi:O-6-methylguanine DNA methyltransferase